MSEGVDVLTSSEGQWTVAGPLTIDNIVHVLEGSVALELPASGKIDLHGVEPVDSSGVAILLEWKRRALAEGKPITFNKLPSSMASLAELYGVDALLADA